MSSPLFVHVGFHKTGTTWLQERLFVRHPEIVYLGKAQDYPDPRVIDLFHALYGQARGSFAPERWRNYWREVLSTYDLSGGEVIGLSDEGLSGGIDWFGGEALVVANRIREVFSDHDIRIVVGIREQCSMLESIYSEYIRRGGTNSVRRLVKSPFSSGQFLLDKLRYYPILERYIDLFGRERVFVYLLEELKEDAEAVVARIQTFLGLEEHCGLSGPETGKVRERLSRVGLLALRTVNLFFFGPFNNNAYLPPLSTLLRKVGLQAVRSPTVRFLIPKVDLVSDLPPYELEQFLVNRVQSRVQQVVISLDKRLPGRGGLFRYTLAADMEEELSRRYSQSNADRLAPLVGKDLFRYGYPWPDDSTVDVLESGARG